MKLCCVDCHPSRRLLVSVANGATLIGVQGQTLTMKSLVLGATSNTNVTLSAPDTTGLFNINGDGVASAGNLN